MSNETTSRPQPDVEQLEAAADQAIAACGGDAREAVKALLVANENGRSTRDLHYNIVGIRWGKQGDER